MKNKLMILLEYKNKLEYVQDERWIHSIIKIGDYYVNGNGAKSSNSAKVVETLNEIVENFVSIEKDFYNNASHGSDDYQFSGKYNIKSKIPAVIGNKLHELEKKVVQKIYEDRDLEDSTTKKIYKNLNELEF